MNTKNPVGRPVTKKREPRQEVIEMAVLSGDSIGDASKRAVRLADARKTQVRFVFGGVDLVAEPDGDAMDCVNAWMRAMKKGVS